MKKITLINAAAGMFLLSIPLNLNAQCDISIISNISDICQGDSVILTATSTSPGGNALQFDGIDDKVSVSHNTSLNVSTDISIEAWIYLKTKATHNVIVAKATTRNDGFYFVVDKATEGGKLLASVSGSQIDGPVLDTGRWYHVAYTQKDTLQRLYVDGVMVKDHAGNSTNINTTSDLLMGRSPTGYWGWANHYYKGMIDEVRIWNTERTQTEISNNMSQTLLGSESGLIAYYKMDEGSGTTVADASSNGDTATLINNPTWMVPSTSPVGGVSLSYTWAPSIGLNNTTGAIVMATPSTTTTYTITGTGTCGTGMDSITITVHPVPALIITSDVSLCLGVPSSLTVNGGENYIWSTGDTMATIKVIALSDTTYSVSSTNVCGADTSSIDIIANPLPIVNLGNDTTICKDIPFTLDAGSGFTDYSWSTGATTQTIIATSSNAYAVTVTGNNGCSNSDTMNFSRIICNAINQFHVSSSMFQVYPNPNNGVFQLKILNSKFLIQNSKLVIYDMLGQNVYQQQLNSKHQTINTKLDKGIYTMQLISDEEVINKKIVVQ